MPRPTRESVAIDRIVDIQNNSWLVREYRDTSHGWPLAIGWPDDNDGQQGATIIMTAALAGYLHATERPRDIDLPIGKTAIKRLRAVLDLSFNWDAWWADRADDLTSMTLEAFCKKHGCSMGAASQRRQALRDAT